MPIIEKPWTSNLDLSRISALIRRAFAAHPFWNCWSFARFDIYAQRRIADAQIHNRCDWQQDVRLWQDNAGNLLGAVIFEKGNIAAPPRIARPRARLERGALPAKGER